MKCFLYDFGFFRIYFYGSQLWFINITIRSFTGPNSISQLLSISSFDIFGKIINIIFGLAKGDGKHKLSLRGIVKPEGGKLKIKEFAGIKEINNFSSINGISG
ncbi:hypothetical protein A2773_00790 [Candidatus Gottesmanbacteria bacterium RIFCSPHIGHO2_01_FULL_39_10]|uniref:Uncharacterized protein n=1 Tax=Candidatus Gottesmanbacteria bacterium RIFCSPHIGHO2_01_FULL_39_10 TaxID=1798375 RepID=A0A1F5ZLF9_9BACT|nr:MAG: hypothetical protein A2773_00790 [Candidatus Gottesmanbacteria bacterium RIFCSPHIGHO2_01_FULL_39_10]